MRHPVFHRVVLLLALVFASRHAVADDRSDARAHYQSGVKLYGGGDYRGAIREFSAAQQLLPADLNNYNLALCYDKLGDADPAIQYYRAYLDKNPSTDKRAEIDASVARLEAASKSAAAKRADEQKRIDDARKADEAKAAAAQQAADDARKADEARKAAEAAKNVPPYGRPDGANMAPPAPTPPAPAPMTGGATGSPSTGAPISTGDAQLDRVQSIDIDQIRDQRMGGSPSPQQGAPRPGEQGPQYAQRQGPAEQAPPQPGQAPNGPAPATPNPNGQPVVGSTDQAKHETPVYKKWWFWAVVAVSAYVLYEVASDNSSDNNSARTGRMMPKETNRPSGLTLFTF